MSFGELMLLLTLLIYVIIAAAVATVEGLVAGFLWPVVLVVQLVESL